MRTSDLADYLVAQGVTAAIDFHGHLPDQPDSAVVIDPRGGASPTFEGIFDRPAIFIQCRGEQADPGSAETLAAQVDAILLAPPPNRVLVGGLYVTNVQRLGGPPSLLGRDDAQRSILAATYIFEVERP